MKSSERHPGFRYFCTEGSQYPVELSVRKLGIRELMTPCVIERSLGTGDYLIMLFHDAANAACAAGNGGMNAPETMMIWTPGKAQYYGNPHECFAHSWIHCDGARVRRILRSANLPVLVPFSVPNPTVFEQCLSAIHSEMISYIQPDMVIVGNLLDTCLRTIARSIAPLADRGARIPENLAAVRRWINSEDSSRSISLSEMAAMSGLSVSHFTALFRKHFGQPPMQYLLQHRMLLAAHLLAN
jgi:AraC family transcriptional regulator, arabinose operon regulatory protein